MKSAITLGANINRMRKEAHLTQDDLASFLGVTKASVSKWETGQSYPDLELLPKIATYFDTTIDVLVGYEPVTGCHVGPGALALFFEGGDEVRTELDNVQNVLSTVKTKLAGVRGALKK